MNRDEFRRRFEKRGFEISEENDGEVLCAENESGDQIWYSMSPDTQEWCLYFDLDRYTLDNAEFDFTEVNFEQGKVTVERVSGTRPSTGLGTAGFTDGIIEVNGRSASLLERH